jgi:hypothetical protein
MLEHMQSDRDYYEAKGYVRQEDYSDCGITAQDIDFIEA